MSACMAIPTSVHVSVRMEHLGCHWKDFHEIWYLSPPPPPQKNLSRRFKFLKNLTRIVGSTLHEDLCTLMIISHAFLLQMSNVSDKFVGKIKTHILCSKTFFCKSCHLWDNVQHYGRVGQTTDDNIIRRMRCACWITKFFFLSLSCYVGSAFPIRLFFLSCHM
jgi:hypothetical protein